MTTAAAARARARLVDRASKVDFASISRADYESWIDSLSLDEFSALISMHQESIAAGRQDKPQQAVSPAPSDGPPGDDDWIAVDGETMPVNGETPVCVMFRDGVTSGPAKASDFLWDEPMGSSQILAYAAAREPRP